MNRRTPAAFCLALALSLTALPALAAKKPVNIPEVMEKAQSGDAKAEAQLGNMYENGHDGVPRDYLQAIQWFQKAVAQGDLGAKVDLAMVYINGHGVARDYSKAAELLEGPAEAGLPQAQYQLGALYEKGEDGRFQDFTKAAEWLTRAANQNQTQAQFDLGDLYFNGQGVHQSYEDACFWYLLAGNHKLGRGQQNAYLVKLGRARSALSADQLDSVQKRAAEWKPVREKQSKDADQ